MKHEDLPQRPLSMIQLRDVTYRYPHTEEPILCDISLSVARGEFLLVIGPSGVGKSTLLRCLNGLVPHFYGGTIGGTVRVGGRDPVAIGPRRMSDLVGFVFQDPEVQFVTRVVEDELAFAIENHNLPQAIMRKRVEEVLDQLSIAHLRQRRVETLSGGERQRVAIGSALTLQPQVLVLDEPTSQLDPQAAEEVLTTLQKLNEDLGLTVVISEHRLERVAQYADRICYLPSPGTAPLVGEPRSVLREADLAPPLVHLGRALNWQPLPLTIKEGRRFVDALPEPPASYPGPLARATCACATPSAALRVQAGAGRAGKPARDWPPSPSASAGEEVITVCDLWYSYDDVEALKGVSLTIRRGEFVALMGRNGSGKTTLLKNIVGLLRPSQGDVHLLGQSTRRLSVEEIVRRVGFVPQDPGRLLFNETLAAELAFTRRAHGLPVTEDEPLLERLGLRERRNIYPRDLSAGERQRAALAAILVAGPQILLLDEPTRGLDYRNKATLTSILNELRQNGITIVMATHDVELVARCAERVVIMGDGQVVVDGPVRQVMTSSLVFSTQINKLLRDDRFLTVEDVL
jgi:energy-coupling factor transporter ATP-binding protein EcfA2